jgi:hypothetical protein
MLKTATVVVIVALTFVGVSCNLTGPSESLAGTWMARGIGHSSIFGLTLQQNGDRITGTACYTDAIQIFSGVPVTGDYPDLLFEAGPGDFTPCQNGSVADCTGVNARFVGRQDSTKAIVGTYANQSQRVDLRFGRTERSPC